MLSTSPFLCTNNPYTAGHIFHLLLHLPSQEGSRYFCFLRSIPQRKGEIDFLLTPSAGLDYLGAALSRDRCFALTHLSTFSPKPAANTVCTPCVTHYFYSLADLHSYKLLESFSSESNPSLPNHLSLSLPLSLPTS